MLMVGTGGGGGFTNGDGGGFVGEDAGGGGGGGWIGGEYYGGGGEYYGGGGEYYSPGTEDYSSQSDSFSGEVYRNLRRDGEPFGYGCGTASTDILVPDRPVGIDLIPACVAHDICYDVGTVTPRAICDDVLGEQVRAACIDAGYPALPCGLLGAAYKGGVRALGAGAYDVTAPPPEEYVHHPLDMFLYY